MMTMNHKSYWIQLYSDKDDCRVQRPDAETLGEYKNFAAAKRAIDRDRTPYGSKRDFPKIDIYHSGAGEGGTDKYLASTTWARTCREAKERHARANGIPLVELFARFDHSGWRT